MGNDNSRAPQGLLARLAVIIGRLTAVVLALVALKAAIAGLFPPGPPTPSKIGAASTTPAAANSVAPPAPPIAATQTPVDHYPQSYTKPNGHLAKQNKDDWIETDDTNGVKFKEQRRDVNETVLFDASRQIYIKFQTSGGEIFWNRYDPISWRELYFISVD